MHINGNEISLCKPTEKEFFQVFPFPLFSCTRSLWLPCLCLRFSLISLVVFYSLDCTLLGLLDTFWYISFYERTPKPKHFRFRMLLTSSSPDAVLLLLTPATSCTVSKQTHTHWRVVRFEFLQFLCCFGPKPVNIFPFHAKPPFAHFVWSASKQQTPNIFGLSILFRSVYAPFISLSFFFLVLLHVRLYQRTTYIVSCASICAVSTSFFRLLLDFFSCCSEKYKLAKW